MTPKFDKSSGDEAGENDCDRGVFMISRSRVAQVFDDHIAGIWNISTECEEIEQLWSKLSGHMDVRDRYALLFDEHFEEREYEHGDEVDDECDGDGDEEGESRSATSESRNGPRAYGGIAEDDLLTEGTADDDNDDDDDIDIDIDIGVERDDNDEIWSPLASTANRPVRDDEIDSATAAAAAAAAGSTAPRSVSEKRRRLIQMIDRLVHNCLSYAKQKKYLEQLERTGRRPFNGMIF